MRFNRSLRVSGILGTATLVMTVVMVLPFNRQAEGVTYPLDPYPGFGGTDGPALRDDAIAFWEGYRKEGLMAVCMAEGGFEYRPEISFPEQAVIAVADYLGLKTTPVPGINPEDWNRQYRDGLDAGSLDQYWQLLVGESAADMAAFEGNGGQIPAGSSDSFGLGGCFGAAEVAVGSIWDAKRSLEDELDQLRDEAWTSATADQARVEFSACMVDHGSVAVADPMAAEELLVLEDGEAVGLSPVAAALEQCMGLWDQLMQAANDQATLAFIDRNRSVLEAQQDRYQNAMSDMQSDAEFMEYLRGSAGLLAFEEVVWGDDSPNPVTDAISG